MNKFRLSHHQQDAMFIGAGAAMAALLVASLLVLVVFVSIRGGSYFWPQTIYRLDVSAGDQQVVSRYATLQYTELAAGGTRFWYQASSHLSPSRQQWLVDEADLLKVEEAGQVAAIRLLDGRTVLARPVSLIDSQGQKSPMSGSAEAREALAGIEGELARIRDQELSILHQQIADLDSRGVSTSAPARVQLNQQYQYWHNATELLTARAEDTSVVLQFADQRQTFMAINQIDDIRYPNALSTAGKWRHALQEFWYFLTSPPKQSNTSGGVFPALFGTVALVFLMTLIVTPFGVLAAVYLSEFARANWLTALVRISVTNMAGVPSVVYGVFGLGFFVYAVGGNIDQLLYQDALPSPTFGTPGLLWAALTMALLTLPVVIVATEEGLKRVPRELRLGSYALGATKAETIWRTVLPLATPGIVTGVILAIARAAGEVAPLLLVGAVKFAPSLPVDGEFPFIHLERQFMHLGALIYDGVFHGQSYSKGSSIVFAVCALLLVIVFLLNLIAVFIRERFQRNRYHAG